MGVLPSMAEVGSAYPPRLPHYYDVRTSSFNQRWLSLEFPGK